ncbi:hypothetical protein D5S17_14355 [Pseudonocardiaceae bacterium YIM PH 21723]|nr:hypothetical protein D5S17_14355 [Pseudonocardiaceae bacterium YIM PH 21723]
MTSETSRAERTSEGRALLAAVVPWGLLAVYVLANPMSMAGTINNLIADPSILIFLVLVLCSVLLDFVLHALVT